MRPKILYLISFFTVLLYSCEKESIKRSIDQEIERVAKKYIIYGRTPGIIIGIVKNGETKIYFYGVADTETGARIDEYTIFEIGSITKTFTSILTAQFVLEGKFALQDTVNKFLPSGIQLPSKNKIPIQWVHLLNHTSGLAREPDNLNTEEPFDYSASQMSTYLSRTNLLTVPGSEHLYSNTGMGLAGYALTIITDSSYSSLLKNRIFSKLNMTYTFCSNNDKPSKNTAQGYYGKNPVDYYLMTDVFAGAGVIKSNIRDLLMYLHNCLNPETSVLRDAINLSLVPTFYIDGKQSVGLGWFVGLNDKNQNIAFHDGGTKGFASFIGMNRDKKTGVIVLMNSYCFGEQDLIGAEIMKILDDGN
jgi:CubicO group peptidase (beta-lactamase class C family)